MPGKAETVGERIRRLRKEAYGETYREADKATGISVSSWANWETKGTFPYGKTLVRLAEALSEGLGRPVTIDEILSGSVSDEERARREDEAEAAFRGADWRARRGSKSGHGPGRKRER